MRKWFFVWWLPLLFVSSPPAWSITGLGIGVKGGMIRNYKNENLNLIPTQNRDWLKEMPTVGVHLKIGTLRIIHLEASVEYAWKKKEIVLADLTRTEFSINDLSLNGTAKYIFSFPGLKPYVGAGIGMHRLVYEISSETYFFPLPEDQNKMGFHGVGGLLLSFPAFPLELSAEVRYTSIRTENHPTRYTVILAGLTFKLP